MERAPTGAAAADAQGNKPDGAIGLLQGGRFGGAWVDAGQAVASNAIMLSQVAGEERFETGVSADTVRETALLCDLVHEAPHPNLTRMYVLFPKLRGEICIATMPVCTGWRGMTRSASVTSLAAAACLPPPRCRVPPIP